MLSVSWSNLNLRFRLSLNNIVMSNCIFKALKLGHHFRIGRCFVWNSLWIQYYSHYTDYSQGFIENAAIRSLISTIYFKNSFGNCIREAYKLATQQTGENFRSELCQPWQFRPHIVTRSGIRQSTLHQNRRHSS